MQEVFKLHVKTKIEISTPLSLSHVLTKMNEFPGNGNLKICLCKLHASEKILATKTFTHVPCLPLSDLPQGPGHPVE